LQAALRARISRPVGPARGPPSWPSGSEPKNWRKLGTRRIGASGRHSARGALPPPGVHDSESCAPSLGLGTFTPKSARLASRRTSTAPRCRFDTPSRGSTTLDLLCTTIWRRRPTPVRSAQRLRRRSPGLQGSRLQRIGGGATIRGGCLQRDSLPQQSRRMLPPAVLSA
jgi:hypothetical protein